MKVQLNKVSKSVIRNRQIVMTGVAIIGMGATVYLTRKNTLTAERIIDEENIDITDKKAIFKRTWKCYIPTGLVSMATVGAMTVSTKFGLDKQAGLAGALALSEAAYDRYKESVDESTSKPKQKEIKEAYVQKTLDSSVSDPSMIVIGENGMLCFDEMTGRYFKSTINDLDAGVNNFNGLMLDTVFGTLNELYSEIGLESITIGNDLGWENIGMVELEKTPMLTADGTPCLCVGFKPEPKHLAGF